MEIKKFIRDIELDEKLEEYLHSKLEVFEKFVGDTTDMKCEVELNKVGHSTKGDVHYAEINLFTPTIKLRATAEKETIEAAIDKVKDDIVRELKRAKKKERRLFRRGAAKLKSILKGFRK
jgi:ribosomal subunit interface protein